MPYRVLYVCTGNICRSAFAEIASRTASLPGIEFASAGTHAVVGAGICTQLADHLGPNATGNGVMHVARQLTREIVAEADLVVTMAAEHRAYILDEWPEALRRTFLIGQIAREITWLPQEATLDELAPHLWRNRSSQPDDGVADPYRQGTQAAAEAAGLITRRLDVILPALRHLSEQ